ncbi:MAG: phosphate ABC transporter substrate-binding protein PstS [Phycisphaerales bacterium]|nr:phosphate ABC transporter substrate-binding protein PstS [Phycisphaerales bacterium]
MVSLLSGVILGVAAVGHSALDGVRLQGAGATFPNPLYQRWAAEYQKLHPGVKIDYESIGSGGGIKGITEKTVDFAGSDAPLSAAQLAQMGGSANVVEFPACAGSVVPAYNLPGVSSLNFSGEVLAEIYIGVISTWDDPKIAALNPGAALPALAITPAWRSDGSGTTYIFTKYLAAQSVLFSRSIGTGKQVQWPVGQGGKGNDGVAAIVQQTAGSIGYMEQNYASANHIAFGAVRNRDGEFVKASTGSAALAGESAAESLSGSILAADLWNRPGTGVYPIASFTYLIVYKDLSNLGDPDGARALARFFWWATHDGQAVATELGYAPLSPAVRTRVEAALRELTFRGRALGLPGK